MTRQNEPSYRKKGLSVFLTVLMILSVVAMSATFVGTVAASSHELTEDNLVHDPAQNESDRIQLTLNQSADWFDDTIGPWNFTVHASNGSEIEVDDVTSTKIDGDTGHANFTIDLHLAGDLVGGDADLEIKANGDSDNVSIERASSYFDDDESSDQEIFMGEDFVIQNTTNTSNVITFSGPDSEFERGFGTNSSVARFTEDDLDDVGAGVGDEVTITSEDTNALWNLTIRSYGIDVETDESEYTTDDDIEVSVDADRVQRLMDVKILDTDGDVQLASYGVQTDANGELTETFAGDDLEEDENYTAVAYDNVTWISGESDEFTVGEPPEPQGEASFGDITDAAEGDNATIEIELSDVDDLGDDDVLLWINQSDYNANISFSFDDDDFDQDTTLEVEWNTFEAGASDAAGGSTPDGDIVSVTNYDNVSTEIHHETNISHADDFRLSPAGYTLAAFSDGTGDQRDDSASLTITERETGDLTTHVLANTTDTSELDWIVDNATESDQVAELDYLVIEQEITGVFGQINDSEESLTDHGLEITIEPDDVPAYQTPETFNLTDGDRSANLSHILDADEGKIYFLLEHNTTDLDEDDTEDWNIEFEVTEDNAYIEDEDDEESTEGSYTLVERLLEISVVEEPYQVTPDENAVIEGTSTLAPNTNISIEVDKPGHFIDTDDTIQVNEDGEWVFTANYSDREIGEEFTILVEEAQDPGEADDEVDGVFNATAEADTETTEDTLQGIVDELTDLLDVDQDELVSTVEQLIEDADDAEDLAEQVEQLQADLSEAQEDAQTWETLYDGAVEDLEQAEADLEQAQDDLEQAESDLSDAQDDIDQLESDLSDAEDTIDELNDEIDELEEDDGVPGFGPIAALFALLAGGALVARRRL